MMLISELEREAKTTRRVLERVPDDKLTWETARQVHDPEDRLDPTRRHHTRQLMSGMVQCSDSYDVEKVFRTARTGSTAAILAASMQA